MFSLPGHTIGDCWFVVHDGTAHCFFCTSPEPQPSWHWDIGHAVSEDLRSWRYVGLALRRGRSGAWDSQTLSTGCVVEHHGRFWMAYSAIRRGENPPTRKVHRVGIAVSDDLFRWHKHGTGPVNQRDPRYYERLGPPRDPPSASGATRISSSRATASTSTSARAARPGTGAAAARSAWRSATTC